MTREEAIGHIKDIICENNTIKPNIVVFEQEKEALYMAIQTLEQEPKTIQEIQAESEKYQKAFEDGYEQGYAQARFDYEQEPCEDAISRQAVLDCLTATGLKKYDFILNARDKIKNLPSVKPQEKTKRCKECKYSEYCRRWGNKYKTEEDDYCFMFESQESEEKE